MSTAAEKSPFKFLDSFEAADQASFFGREKEVEEVYSKVFQAKTLLVYGGSGTGKSSIVNCGLAGKFQPSDWLPIHVRRGGNILRSMAQQVDKFNLSSPLRKPEENTSKEDLKAALTSVFLDHFKPIYLIFDQFEELFIFGQREEWESFIQTLRYLLKSELELHFIFVLRGEYLEYITEFEEFIPGFFDNRVRIEKMTRAKARQTIVGPCETAGIVLENDFEEKLLKKLSPTDHRVELTFLQVYLDKIYKNARARTEEGPLKFTNKELEELGQLGDVLAEFVDEQVFQMKNPKAGLALLKTFVTLQGTKIPRTKSEVLAELKRRKHAIPEREITAAISFLVNRRILKDKDDSGRYELRHDVLASRIFEKITLQEREILEVQQFLAASFREHQKRGSYLSDEDLRYIAPFEKKLEPNAELQKFINGSKKRSGKMRRRRRNRGVLAIILLLFTLAATAGFFYSQEQKQRADALANEARAESAEAEKQKTLAEAERQKALLEKQKAENQRARARLAEQAALEQEGRTRAALAQVSVEKSIAERAKAEAQQNEQKARQQSLLAQKEKARADTLRNLSVARELALQSLQLRQGYQKAHLASAAFQLTEKNKGDLNSPQLYAAFRQALISLEGKDAFKQAKLNAVVADLQLVGEKLYLLDEKGTTYYQVKDDLKPVTGLKNLNIVALESFDATTLWAQSKQGKIYGLDPKSGAIFKTYDLNQEITDFAVYKNELLVLQANKIIILSENGKTIKESTLPFAPGHILGTLAQDEFWLISEKGEILAFNVSSFSPTGQYALSNSPEVTKAGLSPSGGEIYLGTKEGRILRWSAQSGKITGEFPGHISAISDLSFTDNNQLISASFDRSVKIWDLKNPQDQPVVIDNLPGWVIAISREKDGYFYLSTYDGGVYRFPMQARQMLNRICKGGHEALTETEWQDLIKTGPGYLTICP